MSLPSPNPRGQKPYSATMPTKPAKPVNASVGLAAAATARGYTGIDHGMSGDVPLSGVNAAGQRVPFINGKSPEQVAEESAGGQAQKQKQAQLLADSKKNGILDPKFDANGTTVGGVDARTGQTLAVNESGQLRPTGQPDMDALKVAQQRHDAAEAAAAASPTPTANPSASSTQSSAVDSSWKQAFGHDPGTASHPIVNAPPSIPAMPALDPAQASAVRDATAIPDAARPVYPSVQPRNAGGYLTPQGENAAAAAANPVIHPPTGYKIGQAPAFSDPSVPGSEASRTTDAAGNTTVTTLGGGTVTFPKAQPQTAPAVGGSGIVVNGVPQTQDARGNFVAQTARPATPAPAPVPVDPATQNPAFSSAVRASLAIPTMGTNLPDTPAAPAPAIAQTPTLPTPVFPAVTTRPNNDLETFPAGTAAAQTPDAPKLTLGTGAPAAPQGSTDATSLSTGYTLPKLPENPIAATTYKNPQTGDLYAPTAPSSPADIDAANQTAAIARNNNLGKPKTTPLTSGTLPASTAPIPKPGIPSTTDPSSPLYVMKPDAGAGSPSTFPKLSTSLYDGAGVTGTSDGIGSGLYPKGPNPFRPTSADTALSSAPGYGADTGTYGATSTEKPGGNAVYDPNANAQGNAVYHPPTTVAANPDDDEEQKRKAAAAFIGI